LETNSTAFLSDLRNKERDKIKMPVMPTSLRSPQGRIQQGMNASIMSSGLTGT